MADHTGEQKTYIGDGVYASFDGYQIWVQTSGLLGEKQSIALDRDTMESLNRYAKRIYGTSGS